MFGLAAVLLATAAAQAQGIRVQCSPERVEGAQCPQPGGICPDTLLGVGGNYAIDFEQPSVTRFNAEWFQPQRVPVRSSAPGEIVTNENDRWFNGYVTSTFRLGEGRAPITYVLSIFPAGAAAASGNRPLLRSEGTCVRLSR
jgi:hypothetical protein